MDAGVETFPQWWVMKRCRHWDAAKNRRFRLVRLDGPTDYCGSYPCHIFDGERHDLRWQSYGIKGEELLRRASTNEIPSDLFLVAKPAAARATAEAA